MLGVLFLDINGFAFNASEEDAAHAFIRLAAGEIDELSWATFLRAHSKR